MAGLGDVRDGGRRVGEQPDGQRPVGRGDAGRHPGPGVDGDGERGAHPLGVVRDHLVEFEPVEVGAVHRHADHPGGITDHEGQQLRGGLLRREDQVAFVLAVGVVDDDDWPAGGDLRDRLVDRGETRITDWQIFDHDSCPLPLWMTGVLDEPAPAASPATTSFSTYFASTSTSRLTRSPTPRRPRVVTCNVVGIRLTVNVAGVVASAGVISTTVRLTPSTVMDPFSTR